MAIILSNRLKAMQDAAANFGDSLQGIREAQRQAKRQAEADKMAKSRFDQEQELGGLQISAAKAKADDEANQRLAMQEAQGFADDLTGFGTAVPESAIGLQDSSMFGGAPMASPRPIGDRSAENLKDRLTASMLNKMEQAKGGVSALTKDDIAAQRRAAQEKAAQGLQSFTLDTQKKQADIESTKMGTKKTESEIGSGRFKEVVLENNELGVLNTRTGQIEESGKKAPPKTVAGSERIVANKGEILIPDLNPIEGVQITHDSVKKTKEGYAGYQAFKNQLDQYKKLVSEQGSELVGEKADRAEAMLTDLGMKLKNLQDLGVLTGNDWQLMMKQLPSTSGVKASLKGKIYGAVGQDAFGPQLEVLSNSMEDKFNVFARANGFEKAGKPASKFKILSVE